MDRGVHHAVDVRDAPVRRRRARAHANRDRRRDAALHRYRPGLDLAHRSAQEAALDGLRRGVPHRAHHRALRLRRGRGGRDAGNAGALPATWRRNVRSHTPSNRAASSWVSRRACHPPQASSNLCVGARAALLFRSWDTSSVPIKPDNSCATPPDRLFAPDTSHGARAPRRRPKPKPDVHLERLTTSS